MALYLINLFNLFFQNITWTNSKSWENYVDQNGKLCGDIGRQKNEKIGTYKNSLVLIRTHGY